MIRLIFYASLCGLLVSLFFYPLSLLTSILVLTALVLLGIHLPAPKVRRYVLSNGERTLIFQEMIHIASASFYDYVRDGIAAAKDDGYFYFWEGIRRGSKENEEKFPALTHIRKFYAALASPTPLIVQPQASFLNQRNYNDVNADVSFDELATHLDADGALRDLTAAVEKIDRNIETTKKMPRGFIWVFLRIAIRLILLFARIGLLPKSPIVVGMRDKVLADTILARPENGFITYGAAHFPGFMRLMKEADPRWTVVSVTKHRVW